jgi:GxxExxY protein
MKKHEEQKSMKALGRRFSPLSHDVIGCAIEVHSALGPGLLERTYRDCLAEELSVRRIPFEVEHPVAVRYKGVLIECAYRIDLFVNREIVVETKSVSALEWIHEAQILTYMKLSGARTGLLINFNVHRVKHGLRSYIY